jgi:hypothetical protein
MNQESENRVLNVTVSLLGIKKVRTIDKAYV